MQELRTGGRGGRILQLFLVVPRLLCEVSSASACRAESGFQGVSSEMQCSVDTTLMSPGPGVKRPREQNLPKMLTRALGSRGCRVLGGMLSHFSTS